MGDMQASGTKVLLVEGPLNKEQIWFLECLAKKVHCPYEVQHRQPPTAISQVT